MIKFIWILIGLNTAALIAFTIAFFLGTEGRNVDTMEKGWTIILFVAAVVIILLAAVPLKISQSAVSVSVAGFFAALPLTIALIVFLSNKLPSLKKQETMAMIYYSDTTQRGIAEAIEAGDVNKVKSLIENQNLAVQGIRVWDWDGLNYLQFAVRLRNSAPLDTAENTAIIKLLIEAGSPVTPALSEAIKCTPPELFDRFLEAGADPNVRGFVNPDPLLFEVLTTSKNDIDNAILLIRRGADPDIKNSSDLTPMMFAAQNAGTSKNWDQSWRFIRYLLEEVHGDYRYINRDGKSLAQLVYSIEKKAEEENIIMCPDFTVVSEFLHKEGM